MEFRNMQEKLENNVSISLIITCEGLFTRTTGHMVKDWHCKGHFFSEHVIFVYEIEIQLKVRFSAKITKIWWNLISTYVIVDFLHIYSKLLRSAIPVQCNWKMVFCHQNCSELLWEKIVLVIEKIFEITRTIYSNSERSEQFLVTECFFNIFLEFSHI